MPVSDPDRLDAERRAERHVRRGELRDAIALYERLVARFPEDTSLRQKHAELLDSLQPSELLHPGAGLATTPPLPASERAGSPEQEGERLFVAGDFAGAAAAYRRALRERPDSLLIRERLEELFQLARSQQPGPETNRAQRVDPVAELQSWLSRISQRRRG